MSISDVNLKQPQTYLQLIKKSLAVYVKSFSKVYFLSLLIAIIYFMPRFYTLILAEDFFHDLSYFSPIRAWLLLIDAVGFFFFMTLIWRMTHTNDKFLGDLALIFKKFPVIVASILIQIGFFLFITLSTVLFYEFFLKHQTIVLDQTVYRGALWLGLILVIHAVVAIFLFFLFIFYMPLILIENKGVFSSLKKSAWLVWGNWWRTFWVQITPGFCYLLALIMIKFFLRFEIHLFFTGPLQQFSWFAILLQALTFSLFLPWMAAVLLVQLRDLELRKKV